jgi:hypothetical protein
MRKVSAAISLFVLFAAVALVPRSIDAQTVEKSAGAPDQGLQFTLGTGKSHSANWFARAGDLEILSRRVITPMTTGGGDRIEVYTDIEVRRAKSTIRRSNEKRVYSASDLRPLTSRIDVDSVDGASVRSGWRELRYDKQRVTGSAIDPQAKRWQIEKELPSGPLVVPEIAFSFLKDDLVVAGSTLQFSTYNEESNGVEEAYIKVLKREKIRISGTEYDTWKVELKTGRTTATAHYTTAIPRVLLRLKDNKQFQELVEIAQ